MKALRSISIVIVFVVAATLFAYLAFVHPIGTQFIQGKMARAAANAKKIVKEHLRPVPEKPEKAAEEAPPPAKPLVSKTTAQVGQPPQNAESEKKRAVAPRPVPANEQPLVAKREPERRIAENPFKLERSEFSRADIDAIIERRRRIKDKLGEL